MIFISLSKMTPSCWRGCMMDTCTIRHVICRQIQCSCWAKVCRIITRVGTPQTPFDRHSLFINKAIQSLLHHRLHHDTHHGSGTSSTPKSNLTLPNAPIPKFFPSTYWPICTGGCSMVLAGNRVYFHRADMSNTVVEVEGVCVPS